MERADPTAWKAALLGMKTVRFEVSSTGPAKEVFVRAPTADVRPAAWAVAEIFWGGVRTASMM